MGNLRVAVCDDEPMDLVQTITLIQQYDTGKCFDIFSYTRAVDLLKIALGQHRINTKIRIIQ